MDSVKAVVVVGQITEHQNYWRRESSYKGNCKTIQMSGLAANSPSVPEELKEDVKQFYDASPSIDFKLGTVNPAAAQFFDIDGIYEVTFRRIGTLER